MYEVIKKDLRERLSEKRYEHCLRVADVARELAGIYEVDLEKAYLAGLVHDIAKEFSVEENQYYINKYGLPIIEEEFKRIEHSFVGAVYLKEMYDLDDDILEAVRVHTVGSMKMSLLDKIVFVADKIEPNKDYLGIEEERRLARIDIDEALIMCLENNYKKLLSSNKRMYPLTVDVINYYRNNKEVV